MWNGLCEFVVTTRRIYFSISNDFIAFRSSCSCSESIYRWLLTVAETLNFIVARCVYVMYVCTACDVVQLLCYRYPSAVGCSGNGRSLVPGAMWQVLVGGGKRQVARVESGVPSGLANVAPIWGCNAKGKYAFIHLVSLCVQAGESKWRLCVCVSMYVCVHIYYTFCACSPQEAAVSLCACVSLNKSNP